MPKVSNPRLGLPTVTLETLRHPLHRRLNRSLAPVQHIRVHVSLQRHLVADDTARSARLDTPVEPEYVVSGVCKDVERLVRPFGEERHRNGGDVRCGQLGTHAGGDVSEGGEGERREIVRAEFACP